MKIALLDTVLFEDTEKNCGMVTMVDSIDFHEPTDRLCGAFDIEKLRLGKLVATEYDFETLIRGMKRYMRARIKIQEVDLPYIAGTITTLTYSLIAGCEQRIKLPIAL